MRVPLRVSIGIWLSMISLATGAMAYRWYASTHRSEKITEPWPDRLQHASVTVASASVLQANSNWPSGGLRVCFSIDALDSLPAGDRSYYEAHERARQAAKGPLCLDEETPAAPPRSGDRLTLAFTLEDGGIIQPYKLTAGAPAHHP